MLELMSRLMLCHFTTEHLFAISQAFERPYRHKQNLQKDLLALYKAGLVNRQEVLSEGAGANMYYYYLKPQALDFLYEPDDAQELRQVEALFRPVSLGHQHHQFVLMATLLVKLETSLKQLGGAISHFTRGNYFTINTK